MGDTDPLYFDLSNFRLPQAGKSESLFFGMKRSLLKRYSHAMWDKKLLGLVIDGIDTNI